AKKTLAKYTTVTSSSETIIAATKGDKTWKFANTDEDGDKLKATMTKDRDLSALLTNGLAKTQKSLSEKSFVAVINKLNALEKDLDKLSKINSRLMRMHDAKKDSSDEGNSELPARKAARKRSARG
ncbi:unnamed protein product, partial [Prorocentrum cordatum]